jgi:hydrogenase maturation protein HypF
LDWRPLVRGVLEDCSAGVPTGTIAGKFHFTLAESILSYARRVGTDRMVLSGGCFQNRRLSDLAVERLTANGVRAYWSQCIPPNDGGIAVGQAALATGWTEQQE